MKDALQLFAEYNGYANRAMHKVLQGVEPPALLSEDRHSFYGSIIGLLNHVLVSDLVWLSRFKHHFPSIRALDHDRLPFTPESFSQILYEDLEQFREARIEIDELIAAFVDELQEETLASQFTYTNSKGVERTLDLGGSLLHMFNHETHHRGAVAQILDELDVENDYSNLLATVVFRNKR